jgi:hypothetical protein
LIHSQESIRTKNIQAPSIIMPDTSSNTATTNDPQDKVPAAQDSQVPAAQDPQVQRDVRLLTNALGQLEKAKIDPLAIGRFFDNQKKEDEARRRGE